MTTTDCPLKLARPPITASSLPNTRSPASSAVCAAICAVAFCPRPLPSASASSAAASTSGARARAAPVVCSCGWARSHPPASTGPRATSRASHSAETSHAVHEGSCAAPRAAAARVRVRRRRACGDGGGEGGDQTDGDAAERLPAKLPVCGDRAGRGAPADRFGRVPDPRYRCAAVRRGWHRRRRQPAPHGFRSHRLKLDLESHALRPRVTSSSVTCRRRDSNSH